MRTSSLLATQERERETLSCKFQPLDVTVVQNGQNYCAEPEDFISISMSTPIKYIFVHNHEVFVYNMSSKIKASLLIKAQCPTCPWQGQCVKQHNSGAWWPTAETHTQLHTAPNRPQAATPAHQQKDKM